MKKISKYSYSSLIHVVINTILAHDYDMHAARSQNIKIRLAHRTTEGSDEA